MTRSLRAELVVPTLHVGGMERLVIFMAHELRGRGIDAGITVLEEIGSMGIEARESGVPVTLVRTPGTLTNVRAPALIEHFRSRRLDVVHAHSGVWLKAARAARAARVPGVIHTFHGIVEDEPWHVDILRRMASWATDDIVAVSESLKNVLIERARIPAERIDVIINGVDTQRFAPTPDLSRRIASSEDFVIGHVARLDSIKNQEMLLRAFALVKDSVTNAQLVIAGDGPMRSGLEELASSLQINAYVRFVGQVRDTAPLYHTFDAFALSSVSEGTSMSILEAMASGVPVVATAVGGTPALVGQGKLALLVPSNDHRAMATQLITLFNDSEKRQSLANAAREYTASNYSSDAMLQGYIKLYTKYANGVLR